MTKARRLLILACLGSALAAETGCGGQWVNSQQILEELGASSEGTIEGFDLYTTYKGPEDDDLVVSFGAIEGNTIETECFFSAWGDLPCGAVIKGDKLYLTLAGLGASFLRQLPIPSNGEQAARFIEYELTNAGRVLKMTGYGTWIVERDGTRTPQHYPAGGSWFNKLLASTDDLLINSLTRQASEPTPTPTPSTQPQEPGDNIQKLRELKQMLDEGLISEDEYNQKKKELLDL